MDALVAPQLALDDRDVAAAEAAEALRLMIKAQGDALGTVVAREHQAQLHAVRGIRGAQISHPQPLRIGTRGKLWFRRGDVSVTVHATVVWSHLAKTTSGMVYQTGIKLDAARLHPGR